MKVDMTLFSVTEETNERGNTQRKRESKGHGNKDGG